MSALRVVQVGLGGWGRDWAWRVNPAVDEIEVVGYVDSDPEAAARLAALVPGSQRFFGSLAEALEATRPDAALITTTLAGHAPLGLSFWSFGNGVSLSNHPWI